MESSSAGTENMQVCTHCSTSQLVQWLHQSRVIWTNSFGHCLLHSVRQDSVANEHSMSSYIRPNQKCSKYFGSASSIVGAANTFLLSFRIISCVAHLKTKRSRHRWARSFENTFHSNYDVRYGWLTSKFVRPEIQTSSRDMASKSNSWFHLIAGVPTVTQLSWDSARFNFISADDKAEPCLNIPSCHFIWGTAPKQFRRCNWAEILLNN